MEKNVKNALTTILGIGGAFLGAWFIAKTYKKKLSETKEVEDSKKDELVSLGIPKESAETLVEENPSAPKVAYKLCRYNEELQLPEDVLDVKLARQNRGRIIHVKSDKNYHGRDIVDIIFEIPNYTKNGESFGVGDYMNSFSKLIEGWQDKFGVCPTRKLCGYVVIQYQMEDLDGSDVTVVETIEINPKVYESYRVSANRDGLTAFYEDLCRTGKLSNEVLNGLGEQVYELTGDKKIGRTVVFNKVFLGFKITFPLKRWSGDDGITAKDIAWFVNDAYNNFEVFRNNSYARKTWDYVMFHPTDSDGEGIMNLCFDLDGKQVWLDEEESEI